MTEDLGPNRRRSPSEAKRWIVAAAQPPPERPTVLVVDDSRVDRRVVSELLCGKMNVLEAAEVAEARQILSTRWVDLVVTDLVMPGANGLELIQHLRRHHAGVPGVLITSQGSEEIAFEALHRGAASYVPKVLIATELVPTVERVLTASMGRRARRELLKRMTSTHCTFRMQNDPELIGPLVSYLQELVSYVGLCDEMECTRVGVALQEALTNALFHGNLEISSRLREVDDRVFFELAAKRRTEFPYSHRYIEVDCWASREEGTFVVRDEGPGFDTRQLPDPTNPANLVKPSGRGVMLMRSFMDEVIYNSKGNEVLMRKRRPESALAEEGKPLS